MTQIDLKSIITKLIPTFNEAGELSVNLQREGLKITIKEDNSPVTNGDIAVNDIITRKILELTPDIPIISEETVKKDFKNTNKIFWLIDPIDGTKEYIAGKDEFTLNAALVVNQIPVISLVGVPKKNRMNYTYGKNESYLIENGKTEKINCKKKNEKNSIVAVASVIKPSDMILNKLKEYNVSKIVKMSSSYKFCVIATGEFDIYAAKERAHEWDYAAGHAIAVNAGASITTLEGKPFLYGKQDYKNPSVLILRSKQLNV